jgi:hypothetical protein
MPTDEEKDRLIVESLGECWHEWKPRTWHDGSTYVCKKCEHSEPAGLHHNPTLATWPGFGWWWERMQKMECWEAFIEFVRSDWKYRVKVKTKEGWDAYWWEKLIDPTRGRDAAYEFFLAHPEGRVKK